MNKKLIIAAILAIVASYAGLRQQGSSHSPVSSGGQPASRQQNNSHDISALTQQQRVANYLHQYQRLPEYYIRKGDARRQGWDPSRGNLCDVLPGRAIGGDSFSNREGGLPEKNGRRWFEADVNYQCGRRGTDRMLYSSDGLIYLTRDHYRHFERIN